MLTGKLYGNSLIAFMNVRQRSSSIVRSVFPGTLNLILGTHFTQ